MVLRYSFPNYIGHISLVRRGEWKEGVDLFFLCTDLRSIYSGLWWPPWDGCSSIIWFSASVG